jgi:hypothetical protein
MANKRSRRHHRSRRSKTFKNLASSELATVETLSKQFSPQGKSGLNSVDTKTIRKSVSKLQKESKGLLSMMGLNNLFGTKKNRRGKQVSFLVI